MEVADILSPEKDADIVESTFNNDRNSPRSKDIPQVSQTGANTNKQADEEVVLDLCQNKPAQNVPSLKSDDGSVTTDEETTPNQSDNSLVVVKESDNVSLPTSQQDESQTIVPEVPKKRSRVWKRGIYDKTLDKETLRQKRKIRAIDLKLKSLKWTLNQPCEVTGKRQKKAPDRFELALLIKRKNSMDDAEGDGDALSSIPWIAQRIKEADTTTLRMLHRIIFRKQGMFSEKHIRRSVLTFRGFPFDMSSSEIIKRKMPMEKAPIAVLSSLCNILGVTLGERNVMIDGILRFLQHPTIQQVEEFLKDISYMNNQQKDMFKFQLPGNIQFPGMIHNSMKPFSGIGENGNSGHDDTYQMSLPGDENFLTLPWIKPSYFIDGKGIKLKCFTPIVANVKAASYNFIEMLHRLLFTFIENANSMRRNILEFNGFRSAIGSTDYIYRNKLLFALPLTQLKMICQVLCLPTWHRSRQFLIDGIMNFLTSPCLSAMKKTVPPPVSSSGTTNAFNMCKKELSINTKMETEEIEIVPDIHIPDDDFLKNSPDSNDLQDIVKLKNFPNIHYQVISTPASKLNDLHVVLYGRPCPLNNVRKNILEFTSFPFRVDSQDYENRKAILQQMGLESLITVVTVLSLTPYVVDLSRVNIIEAVLKFLLRPSALLNCDGQPSIMSCNEPVKNTSIGQSVSNFQLLQKTGEITIEPIGNREITATGKTSDSHPRVKDSPNKRKSQPPVKVISQSSMSITVKDDPKTGTSADLDEPLAKVQKAAHAVSLSEKKYESDENDNEPLSKFIGHPNDDQLRTLVAKIMKESALDSLTMKQVIKIVFCTYPNYDLAYRKEFIKSVVRHILSHTDESHCSVSTTVLTF